MLTFPSAPLNHLRRPWRTNSSASPRSQSQLTFLKSQPTFPVRDVTHILGHFLSLGFLLWHLWMTRPLRAHVLQGYIPHPHIAAVCMFEQVILLLLDHMRGSIGVHRLWAHPCFSSSVLHVWLDFVMGGRWPYSWCLVGCCRQDLFNIARNFLV